MVEDKEVAHNKLVADLNRLAEEAMNGQFHDFRSTDYPAPKMTLAERLRVLRRDVINGVYDNN